MRTTVRQEHVFDRIVDYVASNIDAQAALDSDVHDLKDAISGLVKQAVDKNAYLLNKSEQNAVSEEILDDMVRLGPLQALMDYPQVTDIMVNGPYKVYVERDGKVELSPVRFRNDSHVLNIAQRIASSVSRRVDEASPMVDARLVGAGVPIDRALGDMGTLFEEPIAGLFRNLERQLELGPVDNYRAAMTIAARRQLAAWLASVLS